MRASHFAAAIAAAVPALAVPSPCQNEPTFVRTQLSSRFFAEGAALGDLDLNGIIDTADLSLMLLDFGPCPSCPDDFDGDGDVTTADIALLLLNFGPTG
jgi:hypothetical protein